MRPLEKAQAFQFLSTPSNTWYTRAIRLDCMKVCSQESTQLLILPLRYWRHELIATSGFGIIIVVALQRT
jgi:hypothetical protein